MKPTPAVSSKRADPVHRWATRVLTGVAAVLLLIGSARARAPAERSLTVRAFVDAAAMARLVPALAQMLRGVGVRARVDRQSPSHFDRRVVLTAAPEPEHGLAVVHVATNQEGNTTVIVVAHDDRIAERDFGPLEQAVVQEELLQYLTGIAEALTLGRAVGVPRAEVMARENARPEAAPARPPAPTIVTAAPPAVPLQRAFGAGWVVQSYAPEAPLWHGPELQAVLRGQRVGGELRVRYALPVGSSADPVGVRTQALSLRTAATLRLFSRAGLPTRVGAGPALELVRADVLPRENGGTLRSPGWQVGPVLSAFIATTLALTPAWGLDVRVELDWDLVTTPYRYAVGARDAVAMDPRPWRAGLAIALTRAR